MPREPWPLHRPPAISGGGDPPGPGRPASAKIFPCHVSGPTGTLQESLDGNGFTYFYGIHMTQEKGKRMDWSFALKIVLFLAGYLVLTQLVLPRLGIQT